MTDFKERLSARFPTGTKIRLIYMDDPYAVPPDTIGEVQYVDDMGMVHMHWENGSSLSLSVEEDIFEVIK